jgi:hypothetical protein
VEHLHPPVFHGNPMDPDGALVTVDWGYDIADYLDRASGLSTTIWSIDDLSRGIRAEYIEVLVSRKGGAPDLAPADEGHHPLIRARRFAGRAARRLRRLLRR